MLVTVTGLVLSLVILVLGDVTSPKSAPPGNTATSNTVQCNMKEDTIGIKSCFCMTFDNRSLDPVVMESCLCSCHKLHIIKGYGLYYEIDTNTTTDLNNVTYTTKCLYMHNKNTVYLV